MSRSACCPCYIRHPQSYVRHLKSANQWEKGLNGREAAAAAAAAAEAANPGWTHRSGAALAQAKGGVLLSLL